MAAPPFRAAGALAQGNAPAASPISANVDVPAGVANGDFLLLVVRTLSASGTVTFPGGWTTITAHEKTSINQSDMVMAYRVASSEPSNYSVSVDGATGNANYFIARMFAWESATYDTSGTWEGTSSSTTIACPSVSAASADSTLICVYGQFGNNSYSGPYTEPSGMTERADSVDTVGEVIRSSVGVADLGLSSSGATGTKNATATDGSTWHLAVSIVIQSAGGASAEEALTGQAATSGIGTMVPNISVAL